MPRSGRACWVHSSATREVIATSRSARDRSPPVTSRALACIAAVLARWPASVTRSRWRESSTTSRRAASSRSTVRTWSGSAWRTAAVSTAGRPAASARPSRWAACERHPGVPSGPPWRTTSTASPSRGQQRLPGREEVAGPLAAPGEHRPADVGVGAEQHEQPARLRSRLVRRTRDFGQRSAAGARPEPRVGQVASRSGLVTGTPRSPRRWVSVTSRHSAAQPTPGAVPPPRPRASTVTRGRRGSTIAPPRTGVRERGPGRPASGPVPERGPGPMPSQRPSPRPPHRARAARRRGRRRAPARCRPARTPSRTGPRRRARRGR